MEIFSPADLAVEAADFLGLPEDDDFFGLGVVVVVVEVVVFFADLGVAWTRARLVEG